MATLKTRQVISRTFRLGDALRGLAWTFTIRVGGGTVGRRLRVAKGATFRYLPHPGWRLGDNVYLGIGAIIEIHPGAKLELGDRVKVMHYSLIASVEHVRIGHRAQIAEFCSVRDHEHRSHEVNLQSSGLTAAGVSIGEDTWIGRGVAILKGSQVGDRTIVGANSVVRGVLAADAVFVGAPARLLRRR